MLATELLYRTSTYIMGLPLYILATAAKVRGKCCYRVFTSKCDLNIYSQSIGFIIVLALAEFEYSAGSFVLMTSSTVYSVPLQSYKLSMMQEEKRLTPSSTYNTKIVNSRACMT
jgi:hypothetical protein